jgi:T5orf172 domain
METTQEELDIVYVLSNPAMPNLIKIGRTSGSDAQSRLSQLYSTGVPVPFKLEYACRVPNAVEVETALHLAFSPNRINPKREFFRMEPEQAIAIMRLLHKEDATEELNSETNEGVDEQSLAAAEQLRRRRPNMNFEEMGIPVGSILRFGHGDTEVTVCGCRKVTFNGEETSLTAITTQLMGVDYKVYPAPHWTFNGKTLSEIYEETYGE